jgi:hypothetical protein
LPIPLFTKTAVAFVVFHKSMVDSPETMLAGFAEAEIVGWPSCCAVIGVADPPPQPDTIATKANRLKTAMIFRSFMTFTPGREPGNCSGLGTRILFGPWVERCQLLWPEMLPHGNIKTRIS